MERDNHKYRQEGRTRRKVLYIVGHVFIGVLFAIAFALVFAFLVQFIWNRLMPAVFDLKTITFWQAFGIIVLAKFLFGGFGHHIHHRDRHDNHRWFKYHDDENRPPGRTSPDWESYRRYWREEGKQAFETYVERVEKDGGRDAL